MTRPRMPRIYAKQLVARCEYETELSVGDVVALSNDRGVALDWLVPADCGCKYRVWRYVADREMKPGRR